MVIIINFSRSGGTLLSRIIGSSSDVIFASEINPNLGINTNNITTDSCDALKDQMIEWYGIQLKGNCFKEVVVNLEKYCSDHNKYLVIRDWTFLDFKRSMFNKEKPKYKFMILEELKNVSNINAFAFVRDAIDVCISSGREVTEFSKDYLKYVMEIDRQKLPVIKYEDLISAPENTIEHMIKALNLPFEITINDFHNNYKCTGDIQSKNKSRGFNSKTLKELPRIRVGRDLINRINNCHELIEANKILGYRHSYYSKKIESIGSMLLRKVKNNLPSKYN